MALRFTYQSEKLNQARRTLMAPHPRGEAESFAAAFELCDRAFHDLDMKSLDDDARHWVNTIKQAMDTSAVSGATTGTWLIKASQMSVDDRIDFSSAIDELAHWFDMRFWNVT